MVDEPHGHDGEVDESLAAGGEDPDPGMEPDSDVTGEGEDVEQGAEGLRDRLPRMSLDRMVMVGVGAIALGYLGWKWALAHEHHKHAPISAPTRTAAHAMQAGSSAADNRSAPADQPGLARQSTPRVINPVHIKNSPQPKRHQPSPRGSAPSPAAVPSPAGVSKGGMRAAPQSLPGQSQPEHPAAASPSAAAASGAPGGSKYLGKAVYLAIHDLTSEMHVLRKQTHSLTTTNRQLTHSVKQLAHKLLAVENREAQAQLALASTESSLLVQVRGDGSHHDGTTHHAHHHRHHAHVHHARHVVHHHAHRPHVHVEGVSKGRAVISVDGHVRVIHDGSHVRGLGVAESIAPNGHIDWRR